MRTCRPCFLRNTLVSNCKAPGVNDVFVLVTFWRDSGYVSLVSCSFVPTTKMRCISSLARLFFLYSIIEEGEEEEEISRLLIIVCGLLVASLLFLKHFFSFTTFFTESKPESSSHTPGACIRHHHVGTSQFPRLLSHYPSLRRGFLPGVPAPERKRKQLPPQVHERAQCRRGKVSTHSVHNLLSQRTLSVKMAGQL